MLETVLTESNLEQWFSTCGLQPEQINPSTGLLRPSKNTDIYITILTAAKLLSR